MSATDLTDEHRNADSREAAANGGAPVDDHLGADHLSADHVAAGAAAASGALAYGDDDFIDDDSWAKPRPRGNRRLTWTAGSLAIVALGLGTFTLGAKLGKSSGSSSGITLPNGTRIRAGGLAGAFGGAGGFGGGGFGRRNGGTGTGGAGAATGAGAASASGAAATAGQSDALSALFGDTGSTGPTAQGKVTKIDATSITITTADGSTTVITIDSKAKVARRTTASLSDLKVGDTVSATGTTDSVGNVAATEVLFGDIEPATTTAATAAGTGATTATTPPPDTSNGLGGLLGG